MGPNPYQPPEGSYAETPDARSRRMFILAGVGAFLASVYWTGLTLLTGLGVASGQSPVRLFLPIVLIVLYAVRGFSLFKGDVRAAQGILWLHGVGGLMAIIQIASGNPIAIVLYGIKLAIHAFGGVTAYLARKSVVG